MSKRSPNRRAVCPVVEAAKAKAKELGNTTDPKHEREIIIRLIEYRVPVEDDRETDLERVFDDYLRNYGSAEVISTTVARGEL